MLGSSRSGNESCEYRSTYRIFPYHPRSLRSFHSEPQRSAPISPHSRTHTHTQDLINSRAGQLPKVMADKMRKDALVAYRQCHEMRTVCFGAEFPTSLEVAATMASLRA